MSESYINLSEAVQISIERMIQFCYLVQMEFEYVHHKTALLPIHLTRFGTMIFQASSFLYSLFDDRRDPVNLLKIWQGFEHPFEDDLRNFDKKLAPFKDKLKLVRNRIGFHGSLSRSHEKAGLDIFDVETPRGAEFAALMRDMQNLALKMIKWYVERMEESSQPMKFWQEFGTELQGYSISRSSQ